MVIPFVVPEILGGVEPSPQMPLSCQKRQMPLTVNYWDIYTIILVFGHFRPGSRFPQLRCIYFNFSFWTFSISDFQSPAETNLPNFTHFQLVIHNRAFMISLKLYFSFNIVNMWVEFCGWGICNKPNELLNIFN